MLPSIQHSNCVATPVQSIYRNQIRIFANRNRALTNDNIVKYNNKNNNKYINNEIGRAFDKECAIAAR